MPSEFISWRGHRIHVTESGQGDPLLLVPGLGNNIEMWVPFMQQFMNRRIIRLDAPGTGLSSTPLYPVTLPQLADLLVAVLDDRDAPWTDVIGFSYGGAVAQQLAFDHPTRVRRLVLAATNCGIGAVPGWLPAVTGLATLGLSGMQTAPAAQGDPLIAGFKSTYPASVSDAVEIVTGKVGTMRYDMKLMNGTNLVGRAATSLVRPAAAAQATAALSTKHSVEMIDEAKPGEVGVIVMEGTLDIAAMGNLMATAALERGMAGVVLDGAIRDMWDIRRMGLTVYARSKSPRTAVGHYATVAKNVPVECAGVTVRPGDIIVADEDGVVVVPQEHAAAVLKAAQEIDDRERGMYPFIRQYKSLQEAIAKFNRI